MSNDKEGARARMEGLQAQLVAAKEKGTANKTLREELRQARAEFRALRQADPDPLGPGDAVAQGGVT